MKRILCLILCLTLALALFGCGGSQEAAGEPAAVDITGKFSVGFGKVDISPEQSVYLRGYGDDKKDRMSTMVADPLYATCMAITDATGKTVLMVATDLIGTGSITFDPVRKLISSTTGVPFDDIMVFGSHNHSGPDFTDPVYQVLLKDRIPQACQAAMEDRKPAQMYTTFCRPEGYNTVRHYLLTDGSYQGYSVGSVPKNQLVGHYGIADNLLQLVKFTREGGQDIVLINWQGHPKGSSPQPYTAATSNYVGILRDTVNAALGCESLFFLSGSGNVNNSSQIPGEVSQENYMELGKELGQEAITAAANFQPATLDKIQTSIGYLNLQGQKDVAGQKLHAISIGDLAFVFAPFEIFDTNAMAVKENSKFPMTFYASCANDSRGYLPTPPSFDWEITYEAGITKYPKGTAENVEAIFLELLDGLFAAGGYTQQPKAEGYITPEFEPYTDGKTYVIPSAGDLTAYAKVKNGFCQLVVLDGTQTKVVLALNEAVAQEVLQHETAKFLYNEQHVIVGVAE